MFSEKLNYTKNLSLFLVLGIVACTGSDRLSDKLKDGLVKFEVQKSTNKEFADLKKGKTIYYGPECKCTKKIGGITYKDTLFVRVKNDLNLPLNYDAGFEFKSDTLFLYLKSLSHRDDKSIMFSDINYTINLKQRKFKEIVFKQLK